MGSTVIRMDTTRTVKKVTEWEPCSSRPVGRPRLRWLDQVEEDLTLRRLMSYIYMEHPFLMFLDHTQRRSTVGRTPLDE